MAHHTAKSSYNQLVNRLNKFPQGAPPSEALFDILKILLNEKEAELVSKLPIRPFTAEKASQAWKLNIKETQKQLDELASRAFLVDMENKGRTEYVLPPPMAGFIEFSMMRIRKDVDQKLLGQLYYQYLNVEEDFIKNLFLKGETQLGRVFVQEPVLSNENALHVLDYERVSEVIKTSTHTGVSMCYCRHKMMHVGKACDAPLDICMTFNTTGAALINHGHARSVDVKEGLDLLQQAWESNLVQFGENNREGVNFICNCCSCCCEAMITARKFGFLQPVHTSNFLIQSDQNDCKGCGKCIKSCPVNALELTSANDPQKPKRQKINIKEEFCLGCGVCVRNCNNKALLLRSRKERVLTPLNTTHRTVMMAIERGLLQNLIFDNQVLLSHRMLATVLGVILKLPPVKQVMASQQIKSKYLGALIGRLEI